MSDKPAGWLVQLGNGTYLKNAYDQVVLFTQYPDALRWAHKHQFAVVEPLARYDRRQRS